MTRDRRLFWRDGAITLAALLVLLAWDASGFDLAFARAYGGAQGFAWRDAWLTQTVLHDGGRWAAWGLLALMVADAVRPLLTGPQRRVRWYWIAVTLACVLLVPAIKRATHSSCPWDLAEFGGIAAYVPHWQWGATDGGPGHCFPSGHAVAAFAFFGGYFGWRGSRPTLARTWLGLVITAGLLFGWAQLARGAHYPSHTLWSAWLCWTLCAMAAHAPRTRRVVVDTPPRTRRVIVDTLPRTRRAVVDTLPRTRRAVVDTPPRTRRVAAETPAVQPADPTAPRATKSGASA